MISPRVSAILANQSIKKFLKNKGININKEKKERKIDQNEGSHIELLNQLMSDGVIPRNVVKTFVLNELRFGKLTNVFVKIIDGFGVENAQDALSRVSRSRHHFGNHNKITDVKYINPDILQMVQSGVTDIIYFNAIDNEQGVISKVEMLIGWEMSYNKGGGVQRYNNYCSIIIDFNNGICSLGIKDWANGVHSSNIPENVFKRIYSIIQDVFGITSDTSSKATTQVVYSFVHEMTSKILSDSIKRVDSSVGHIIDENIDLLNDKFQEEIELTIDDRSAIVSAIKNNLYRAEFTSRYDKITDDILKKDLGLYAYPRQIRFKETSVGEGNAKSASVNETIFETSLFYDMKYRLDQSKNVVFSVIYWLPSDKFEKFGVSLGCRRNGRIKLAFYNEILTEVEYNEVLSKISEYYKRA